MSTASEEIERKKKKRKKKRPWATIIKVNADGHRVGKPPPTEIEYESQYEKIINTFTNRKNGSKFAIAF
jgi:hypothetical protein